MKTTLYCKCLSTGNIGDTNYGKDFLYKWYGNNEYVTIAWLNGQRDGTLKMDTFLNHFQPISEATARVLYPYNFD